MKTYDKYRPSGIGWIGDIPEKWSVLSLKYIVSTKITDGPHETPQILTDGVPFVSAESVRDGKIDFNLKRGFISKEQDLIYSKKCKPRRNDIFIVKSGSTTGKIAFVDFDDDFNIWSPLALVRTADSKADPRYIYHFLQTDFFQDQVKFSWSFGTQPNIGMNVIENLKVIVPTRCEQTAIANYLDEKTVQVDSLINNKVRLIKLLKEERTAIINQAVTRGINPQAKLKPSGITWLGSIPEHWEVLRFKFVAKIKYGLGQPPKQQDDGLPLIRATNIERGKIVEKDLIYVDPEDVPYDRDPILKENDIIIVRSGAYTGDSAIVPKKYEGAIAGYDMVVRIIDANPTFISYCLLSNYVLVNQLFLQRLRAAQPHLNKEELGETLFLLPDIEEQKQIVEFIEAATSRIEATIVKIEKEIGFMREYRTALISEVVTGKIKVV